MQLSGRLNILWHYSSLGLEWKLTLSSPVATGEFPNLLHVECSTLTAFRTLNSSAGIPSLPLALFVVMLLKAHFTSHSWMSGSSWLCGSLRTLFYNSSVYSCHFLLLSSDSVRSLPILSCILLQIRVLSWQRGLSNS